MTGKLYANNRTEELAMFGGDNVTKMLCHITCFILAIVLILPVNANATRVEPIGIIPFGVFSAPEKHRNPLQKMAGGLEHCKGLAGDPNRNDDTRTHNATPTNKEKDSAIACCQGIHDRLGIHTKPKNACSYEHVQQEHMGCL